MLLNTEETNFKNTPGDIIKGSRVEPKVDGLATKRMAIFHEGVKVG